MTPPLRPLPPAVRKAFAAYQKRPLDRLSDLAGLSRETGDAVQSFGMGATEPLKASTINTLRRGIEAWHGSPHKFDKFSLEKIGTGEGAQAYGHGLYFAENPVVAKGYREKLSVGSYDPDRGVQPDASSTAARISRMFEDDGMRWRKGARSIDDVVRRFATKHRKEPSGIHEYTFRDGSRWFELPGGAWDVRGRRDDGALYRVRLDVSPDELLDWDKPLSQNGEVARKAVDDVRSIYKEIFPKDKTLDGDWRGGQLYQLLQKFSGSQSGATRDLQAAGAKGIRYLDGGSRAAGDGTRNYVIFDPERIQILERLAALGLGGQMVKDMLAKAKAASASQQSQPPTLPPVTVRPPSTPRS